MNDIEREQFLKKVVAISGFLFALFLLPLVQHALTEGKMAAEQGDVAGVSTTAPTTHASVEHDGVSSCTDEANQRLAEIEQWRVDRLTVIDQEYQAAVQPYITAKEMLTGTPEVIAQEGAALDALIAAEDTTYTTQREEVMAAAREQSLAVGNTCSK